eukprot:TRINITY_DN924_c0_g2_i1.p1 TRINITY_DN924_c0_g2~~TRINITY_DN924_c0_g2_i1.p1  ORF type:complete len:348 (-),score=28.28 TRINITY_DN924_c0_g2_i1:4439-5482(-)
MRCGVSDKKLTHATYPQSMTDSVINFMHNVRFVVSKISAYSTNFVARNTVGYSRPRHTDGESAVGLSETDISTALWHHSSSLDCLKPLLFDNIASSSAHVVFMEKPPKKASKRRHTPQFKLLPGPEGELLLPHNRGKITYYKNFLTKQQADRLLQATANARSWARTPVTFFGKQVLQPRDTAFFGTKLYTYSDERREPTGWEEDPPASNALHEMGKRIETFLGLPQDWFNVILANRYHNGRDFMGWHSDNERSLGSEPIIASISLGAERRFLVRLRKAYQQQQPPERIEYVLEHGSLLVMSGKMQSYYQHSLPKVALSKCNELRLNFTYRRVVNDSDHTKDQPAVAR